MGLLEHLLGYHTDAWRAQTWFDRSRSGLVTFAGQRRTRFAMLNWNLWHTWEHYGNVVVYLRMKALVPPSSEKMRGMQMK